MTIPVFPSAPTAPGTYLFVGRFTRAPELVNVYLHEPASRGGLAFPMYLAASGPAQRSIAGWDGHWSAPLTTEVMP